MFIHSKSNVWEMANSGSNTCNVSHLKRKSWLLIVNSDKYFTHDQLFTVISKHKFCTKIVIIFSLLTDKKPKKDG